MDLKRRDDASEHGAGDTHAPTNSVNRLDELRRQGEALLAAGDDAIDRALSGDSQAFNAAVRQQGGQ